MDKLIEKALTATRESKYVEFKSEFDTTSTQGWCEIIKDIVAISNSGGGVIAFGLNDSGQPAGYDAAALLGTDSADITNKMSKYIGQQFSDFHIQEDHKEGHQIAIMVIEGSPIPIVFKKPGTYSTGEKQQKTAFKEGSVYFRHGAKSAPGNTEDLQRSFQKELDRVKKSWLSDIGKIVKAPSESEVVVVSKAAQQSAGGTAALIRLTTDPNASAYRKIDFDITHPYRQKELINHVKEKLPEGVVFNSYDVTSLWYAHNIGDHPEFHHTPKFGSTQYSDAYVEWILNSHKNDREFFNKARAKHYEIKHP
ncbi:putative DNA binding domain-containing protein [Gammaproteobacteria bacterium AH-315-M22]|nr:putative DNA binding domain-containing protein [Gammaproteobacteria bacterium AH-315-M22]